MNRNESPRVSNKLYEILKEIIIVKGLIDNFSLDFCEKLKCEDEMFIINVITTDNKNYFKGYPTGNYLRICAKILEIWNSQGFFPVNFIKIEGLKDQTASTVEKLNTQTYLVNSIFNSLKENNIQTAYKLIINFLESIGMRGILTLLGIRTTPGSFDGFIMKKEELIKSFNAVFKYRGEKREDNMERNDENKSYTRITVGARSLSKHSDRIKDSFWGILNGTEEERNLRANQIFQKLIEDCVWINLHYLPNSTKILELRNSLGYGIRWSITGEFRGLVEPENLKDKIKNTKEKNMHNT